MIKRTNYSNSEIEWVLQFIKQQGTIMVDCLPGSPIKNLAGDSEGDYNLKLLFGILQRLGVARQIHMDKWVDDVGYTRVTSFSLTDKHYEKITPGTVDKTGQVSII